MEGLKEATHVPNQIKVGVHLPIVLFDSISETKLGLENGRWIQGPDVHLSYAFKRNKGALFLLHVL